MRVDEKEAEIVFISKLQGQNQVQMCFKDDDKKNRNTSNLSNIKEKSMKLHISR